MAGPQSSKHRAAVHYREKTLRVLIALLYMLSMFQPVVVHAADTQNPTIEYSASPSTWTNQSVEVTVTAEDDIGVEGIYENTSQITTESVYTFNTATNTTRTFTAKDTSANESDPLTVTIDYIDTIAPSQPSISFDPAGDWSTSW